MRTFLHIAACLAALAGPLPGQLMQTRQPSRADQWTFGFSLLGGIPLGEFRQHEDGGMGGELSVGYQPVRRQPLVMRFSGGAMQYGAVRARGFQEVCDTNGCYLDEVEYNARSHNMWYAQFGPEITAIDHAWRPFMFALAGITGFTSRANLKPTNPGGVETSQGLYNSTNFSTTYGVGVRRVWNDGGRAMGIELSPRFTRNADATYLNEEGVQRQPDGSWIVTPRRGAAHVLGIYLGFWVGPRVLWTER
jgi:hypothetical protein